MRRKKGNSPFPRATRDAHWNHTPQGRAYLTEDGRFIVFGYEIDATPDNAQQWLTDDFDRQCGEKIFAEIFDILGDLRKLGDPTDVAHCQYDHERNRYPEYMLAFVAFQVYEPLSAQKLWLKKVPVDITAGGRGRTVTGHNVIFMVVTLGRFINHRGRRHTLTEITARLSLNL